MSRGVRADPRHGIARLLQAGSGPYASAGGLLPFECVFLRFRVDDRVVRTRYQSWLRLLLEAAFADKGFEHRLAPL